VDYLYKVGSLLLDIHPAFLATDPAPPDVFLLLISLFLKPRERDVKMVEKPVSYFVDSVIVLSDCRHVFHVALDYHRRLEWSRVTYSST